MRTRYIFPLFLAVFFAVFAVSCSSSSDEGGTNAPTKVTIFQVNGVVAPFYGGTPVTRITESAQYTGTVTWSPAVSGTFAASTVYIATITLTAKSGYTFEGVTADFFKVAGATATNSADSGVVTAVFPRTGTTLAVPVTIRAISGVTAPATGGTPRIQITESTQYTGTVAWSPTVSGTFAANTVYTATITLTAKAGYTFTGVAANFFTVAGATATNSANSGIVRAVFPRTGAAQPACNPGGYIAISTEAELRNITLNDATARYYLKNDIALTSDWTPLGAATNTPFQGNFNGCGHTISNLNIGDVAYANLGLFSVIELGYISNLRIIGTINATSSPFVDNVGLLAGKKWQYSTIDNCSSEGSITAGINNANVGGLVGYNIGGIEGSFSKAAVTSVDGTAGGLVGYSETGLIKNSYALGNVVAASNAGGLVGQSEYLNIVNSYAAGDVNSQYLNAGGLVGKIEGNGEIASNVAANSNVTVQSGSATVGRVYGDASGYTGGNLHDNAANSSMTLTGGTVTNPTGGGKDGTDANIGQQSTYTGLGWNFTTIWQWDGTRPVLRWE